MTRHLFELQDLVSQWFHKDAATPVDAMLDALPSSTLEIISRVRDNGTVQFESISAQRVQFTILRVLSRILCNSMTPLVVRAEIELTHRCNFACSYCHTRLAPNAGECALDEGAWRAAVDRFAQAGCRYLHLNGGEVSLLAFVPDLVRFAKTHNMKVGLSSNGSGNLDFYRRVVDAGIDFIHISYDVAEKQRFETLCSRRGAWERVDEVMSWLANEGRIANPELFVVGNLVLTPETIEDLPATVSHLAKLGVDDIKLLPVPELLEERRGLGPVFRHRVRPAVAGLIGNGVRFRMLRSRLSKLFDEPIHGMRDVNGPNDCLQACELGSEQVMVRKDGVIAPCFIYMREQYKAKDYGLGSVGDKPSSLANLAHTVFSASYIKDQTCRQFCPDMIRDSNREVQRAVSDCIVDLLRGSDAPNLITAGEVVCSYRELEAPLAEHSDPHDDGVFCVPRVYAVSARDISAGAECRVESVAELQGEGALWRVHADPRAAVHSRLVGHFLRTSGGYASFRVAAGMSSRTGRIPTYLKSRFDLVGINAQLVTAGSVRGSWQIPLPVVIGI